MRALLNNTNFFILPQKFRLPLTPFLPKNKVGFQREISFCVPTPCSINCPLKYVATVKSVDVFTIVTVTKCQDESNGALTPVTPRFVDPEIDTGNATALGLPLLAPSCVPRKAEITVAVVSLGWLRDMWNSEELGLNVAAPHPF